MTSHCWLSKHSTLCNPWWKPLRASATLRMQHYGCIAYKATKFSVTCRARCTSACNYTCTLRVRTVQTGFTAQLCIHAKRQLIASSFTAEDERKVSGCMCHTCWLVSVHWLLHVCSAAVSPSSLHGCSRCCQLASASAEHTAQPCAMP